MNFFIIVTFIVANSALIDRPLYIFQQPNFKTIQNCKQYVSAMHQRIYATASASYNFKYTPEAIFCLNTQQVKDIFQYNYDEKEKKNI
tara:strand:- start:6578 stop:6841 length:264 start_codon:yes stop_codon:yes gene_type:complete